MDNGSLPIRTFCRLPVPLSDQLVRNLTNSETLPMGLVEGKFALTWFLTNVLVSKLETKVSSVHTWPGDTAEGVYMCIFSGRTMTTEVHE